MRVSWHIEVMFRQRLRFFFTKEGPLRFLSHHDLMRLVERALRRTGLPLKLSEGFNPRPQISFPVALALGIESECEIFETELTRWISPMQAGARLEDELPEGIGVKRVESVRHGEKAEITSTEFLVRAARLPEDFDERLKAFLDSTEAVVTRHRKSGDKRVNVREFVRHAALDQHGLRIDLRHTPAGSVRPEEVLEAVLQEKPQTLAPLLIRRTRLELAAPP